MVTFVLNIMARIGRQIPHFDAVDLSSIKAAFSDDKKYRYLLSLKYSDSLMDVDRDKSIAVILKNPSSADEQKADATIRKVETFVYHRFPDVRWIHILNIFAFRATEPGDLNDTFTAGDAEEVIGLENDSTIEKLAEESDYLILAWGNSSGINRKLYEDRISRVKELLKEIPVGKVFRVSGAKETIHPLHGLMWGYEYTIKEIGDYLNKE